MNETTDVLFQFSPYLSFLSEDQSRILVDQKRDFPADQNRTLCAVIASGSAEKNVLLNQAEQLSAQVAFLDLTVAASKVGGQGHKARTYVTVFKVVP